MLSQSFSQVSIDCLRNHVYFLAADSLEGRRAGSRTMDEAQNYIVERFRFAGVQPLGESYFQEFPTNQGFGKNIIGIIEGSDSVLKTEYILLGAHYDHIGWKTVDGEIVVYNGADDNASGTAVLLELARILNQNKALLKRSIIIAAFDAEESGLIGSTFFVDNTSIDIEKIKAALSIDMVGWYNLDNKIIFDGCASFEGGVQFMKSIPRIEDLNVEISSSSFLWKDRTDTKPFYYSHIPSIHVTTGESPYYHEPEDDAGTLSYDGMKKIADQLINVSIAMSGKDMFEFTPTKEMFRELTSTFMFGINLSVNQNKHIYSEGPFDTKNLWGFGGGLIAQFNIHSFMDLKTEINYEYLGSPSFAGDIRLHNLNIPVSLMFITAPSMFRIYASVGGYYSYSFKGKLYVDEIDWSESGFNRYDYGVLFGFGLNLLNLQFDYSFSYGIPGFYTQEPLSFMDIGYARNAKGKITISYFLTN